MPKIYISYRHVEPDQSLAQSLVDYFQRDGLEVFIDCQMLTGIRWIEEIESRFGRRTSSSCCYQKIPFAAQWCARKSGSPTNYRSDLTAVSLFRRCAPTSRGALPYDLSAYLDTIQYAQQLEAEAISDAGPFGDHLRPFLWSWQCRGNEDLKAAMLHIHRNGQCDSEEHFRRLNSAGMVRGETRNAVQARSRLYQEYFKKHL